ncbi:conserved hypothetical protein [Hyella patelloides LEGE 07179]|uniref:Uncharacterized protein n=1 Tax=Hyella patelloides LEGE 07179 TaxID=945734 RepID=A0A563VT53_9CYAN|nr:hypothetical protein [Hyella patelloides]VEP14649.1 conserved hypothetical protein [Hyella patelloides LEGE 07179]VEP14652.1 conserved hypothetical protein [Hyella patelloides LEGE 07179]
MSYLKKPTLPQQQSQLKKLIDERLQNEEIKIRQRVYQWLSNNQYFLDNELFDFYFCVAQNLAAVEVLGASGEKIVKAKMELEESALSYSNQFIKTARGMTQQLESQLSGIEKKQDNLEWKLVEVIEGLAKENHNLQTISTGLVNSTTVLLTKQKQMLMQTENARKFAFKSVIIAWIVPIMALVGWLVISLLLS